MTWTPKSFANLDPDEEINYRFTKVAFKVAIRRDAITRTPTSRPPRPSPCILCAMLVPR